MLSPSSLKQNRIKHTNITLLVWFFIFFIIFALIGVNVFYVSIGGRHYYSQTDIKAIADQVYIKEETIIASRGKILDRNNNILAEDVVSYKIIAYLSDTRIGINNQPAYVVDKEATAQALAPILNMDKQVILDHLNKPLYQTELGIRGRNLSLQQRRDIEALQLPGLVFETMISRNYPLGVFASHLVGFSQYDETVKANTGRMGLEASYNRVLTGANGWRRFQSDISGFIYRDMYYEEEPAIHGDTLVLTLDKGIQETLELAFEQTIELRDAELVWGMAMEVLTGDIVAWGHAPSFDPNAINISTYENVVSQNNIEPGSTMKTFVYAAAMDMNQYNGDVTYPSGVFHMGIANGLPIRANSFASASTSIYNAGQRDFGVVSLDTAYSLSLNTGIGFLLTQNISPKDYENYLDRFGFFKPVQSPGIFESTGHKLFNYPIEMITSGYGQGSTVTTLQMMQAYTAVFSDGTMVKPRVVNQVVDGMTQEIITQYDSEIVGRPISASTAKKLQDLMRLTAEEGSARFYNIPELDILAKTGTANIVGPNGYYQDRNLYSVVIGLPADNPQVMVYYGYIAPNTNRAHIETGPVQSLLRKIAMTYQLSTPNTDPQEPSEDENPIETKIVDMPSFINKPTQTFVQFAIEHGFDTIIWGDGPQIIDTSFKGLPRLLNTTRLFVKTNQTQETMVSLIGLSKKEVTVFAQLSGLSINIEGEGWVIEQNISEHELIQGQTITVICSLNP